MDKNKYIDIVFDGPPAHESGRFVEVEDASGKSISIGEWVEGGDGLWRLRIADFREAERTIEGFETRIGELLGDSIKNHREEYEFLDWVGDEVDKRDATIEALTSQLARAKDMSVTLFRQKAWGHAVWMDSPEMYELADKLDALLYASPSHTCPGCEDYKKQLATARAMLMMSPKEICQQYQIQSCHICDQKSCGDNMNPLVLELAAKDKRLGEARGAWGIINELVDCSGPSEAEANAIVTMDLALCDTALNGGDSFLSGNPHHLSTDTALNGKEGEDG